MIIAMFLSCKQKNFLKLQKIKHMKNLIKNYCSYCSVEYLMIETKKHNLSKKHKLAYKEFQEFNSKKSYKLRSIGISGIK
jgi:hypothetical protein